MQEKAKIFIKGMVCNRCVATVSKELESLGYTTNSVRLGEVTFDSAAHAVDLHVIEEKLEQHGFSLLEDRKVKMIQEVKQLVEDVYTGHYDFPNDFRFADLIKKRVSNNYEMVSGAFVEIEKMTLERYIINYRINKVKEFLVYADYTLSEIAFRLNFSSVSHLSAQFKQVTGLTPSFFKDLKKRKSDLVASAD